MTSEINKLINMDNFVEHFHNRVVVICEVNGEDDEDSCDYDT